MSMKLGIIGFGGMGKFHSKQAPKAGVTVIGAADIKEERVQEAIEAGIKGYHSADELLARTSLGQFYCKLTIREFRQTLSYLRIHYRHGR